MNGDRALPRVLEKRGDPAGDSRMDNYPPPGGDTLAVIGRDGRIEVSTSAMSELYGCTSSELVGEHWSVLCCNADAGWLEETRFGNPALHPETRCFVGLPGGDGPVRVGELNLLRLPGGGWLWLIGRVSAGAVPPFSPDELRTLLGHCFHSLRGPLTSVSTAIQMLSHDPVPHWHQLMDRRCEQALGSLISVEEMIEDCSVVLESVLGTLSDEASPTLMPGFLSQIVRDREASGSVAFGEAGAGHHPISAEGEINLRRRLFRCLFLRLLRLCERFKSAGTPIDIKSGLESPGLRIQFSSEGMALPEAVSAMLRTPLSLHGPECRQSAFFFHFFVIGLLLRELRGSIEVSKCAATGGDTVVLHLSSPSAVPNEIL